MARISFVLSLTFLAMMSHFILHSSALQFVVGGEDGWVLNPKESYDHWAQRWRFLVNDTLLFKYSNATDSVLAVSLSDYDNCNVNNPVIQLYGGESVFQFGHSGLFYFITGNKTNCDNGQKVFIRVLAVRTPPPPVSPAPATPPPSTTPPSAAPSPATGSVPPLPPPTSSPTPSGSVPPSSSPATQTPPVSPSPSAGGNAPADINAPAASPNKSSATATFTPAVSFVLIMALGWCVLFST